MLTCLNVYLNWRANIDRTYSMIFLERYFKYDCLAHFDLLCKYPDVVRQIWEKENIEDRKNEVNTGPWQLAVVG